MYFNLSSNKRFVCAVKSGLRVLFLLLMLVPLFHGATVVQAENDIEWIQRVANHHQMPAHAFVPINTLGPDGSVYVFGSTDGILEGQTPIGQGDLYIKNYDPDGTIRWERQFGTTGADSGQAIAVDSTGIYVSGVTTGAFEGFTIVGEYDNFIAKYDLNGNLVWAEQFGCADYDDVSGMALTADGVYITGENICAFEGGTPYDGWDVYVRKYNLEGALQWSVSLGTAASYYDESDGIAADASGAYWAGRLDENLLVKKFDSLTGEEVWSQGIQGTGTGSEQIQAITAYESRVFVAGATYRTFTAEPNAGGDDAFILTLGASDGMPGWVHQFGTPYDDEIQALAVGSSGVYAGGFTRDALPGSTYIGGYTDAFIKQYSLVGSEGWTLQYGTAEIDYLDAIALSPEGIYLNGYTEGPLDGQTNIGTTDLYLKKINLDASPAWTQLFHPIAIWPDHDEAYSLDANGYIYMAGISLENRMEPTQSYSEHAFVAKYSPAGDVIWSKKLDSNSLAYGVAAAADGYVYVAGYTGVPLNGQPGSGAFIAKYDPDGNAVWTRYFTGYFQGRGDFIAADDSGVYLTGINGYAKFVLKFSAEGDLLWRQEFGSWRETVTGIAVHNFELYLSGNTSGSLDGQTSAGGFDAFIRKYDLNGGLPWTRQFGTASSDSLAGIAVDDAGIYVTGETYGTMGGQVNIGRSDTFVQKYSLDGNTLLWTRQFGTPQNDFGTGIAVDQAGVYAIGNTDPDLQSMFDKTPFIRVLSPDGEDAWSRSFNNQTELGEVFGVAVDAGGVYVSGNTWMLDNFYSNDATLIKLSPLGNEAPVVGAITAPAAPVAVNTPVTASASFTDANTGDTHTATWDWGNGNTSTGTVTESGGAGTISGTNTYTAAGVYEIGVTVADQAGLEGSATYQYVVVYDPSAGFVTGAGWFISPTGAYKADESLTGKATFGFVSKYQKGASVPMGNTAFEFDLAAMKFSSQSYEWLVVDRAATNAQFKGSGMLNGAPDPNGNAYKFMIWAGDHEPDTFRIKIWWEGAGGAENIVYDNGAALQIGGGNIVVHVKK